MPSIKHIDIGFWDLIHYWNDHNSGKIRVMCYEWIVSMIYELS